MGDFSGLEAECFVESYEHEWCAFVGFLALARTLSLTPIAPAKASSVLRPLICLVRSRKPSRNCILYSAISDSFRNLEFLLQLVVTSCNSFFLFRNSLGVLTCNRFGCIMKP